MISVGLVGLMILLKLLPLFLVRRSGLLVAPVGKNKEYLESKIFNRRRDQTVPL